MDIGLQMVFTGYGWDEISDQQVWDEELKIAEIAADSGFDCLWAVEHHFREGRSHCPAPEVLLGSSSYSFPIDVWSVGCILGELLLNQALLPGNSEIDQLKWIFHLLGEL